MARRHFTGLLAAALLLVTAAAALGQAVDTAPAAAEPRVIAIGGTLELDSIIEVSLTDIDTWAKATGHSPWRLVPYLDGRALAGTYPVAVNLRRSKLQFRLAMTPANNAAWIDALSPPTFTRPVRFSVGLELMDPFDTALTLEDSPASLVVIEPFWAGVSFAIGATFAVWFLWLAATTDILTERSLADRPGRPRRFSLAKTQLAVWFFIIFFAFITIWLATGNYDTINGSIVTTLGISVGTALGDAYISSARDGRTDVLPAEPVPRDPIAGSPMAPVRRFFQELMSDDSGHSIYRFQMVAWTIALTMVFLTGVYFDLTMPVFRPELLYLLGVSSGTYVANRLPEARLPGARRASPPDPVSASTSASATSDPSLLP